MRLTERLALALDGLAPERRVLVAVDGPDAAGKTTLADVVAALMSRPVVRVSTDYWHLPRAVRLRRGPDSPEGCYRDSFDLDRLRAECLDRFRAGRAQVRTRAFDHRADSEVSEHRDVPESALLLVDGVFLLRPELAGYWDVAVHLDVPEEVTLSRAEMRGEDPSRYVRRYLPAQVLYREEADPHARADVLVDHSDPQQPRVLRWRVPEPGSSAEAGSPGGQ